MASEMCDEQAELRLPLPENVAVNVLARQAWRAGLAEAAARGWVVPGAGHDRIDVAWTYERSELVIRVRRLAG